jgi:hypothetical protein
MIVVAPEATFDAAAPIEPVLSARNTMSGFGGIAGVWTVFVMVTLVPEASVALYGLGSTPEPDAAPTPTTSIDATAAATPTNARLRMLGSSRPQFGCVIAADRRRGNGSTQSGVDPVSLQVYALRRVAYRDPVDYNGEQYTRRAL